MEEKYSEKLARLVLVLAVIALIYAAFRLIGDIIGYILLAALVALLSFPLNRLYGRMHIKDHKCPGWLSAILSMLTVFILLSCLIITVVPLIRGVIMDVSKANVDNMAQAVSVPLADFNHWMRVTFPKLGPDFKIESSVLEQIQKMFDVNTLTSVVGSVTTFLAKTGVALFAVIFISFFFIKDPDLFARIVLALSTDRHEDKMHKALSETKVLVTRYFVGLTVEVLGVSVVSFLGLLLVGRMGFKYSIGIAFMAGVLNIIPYVGPLLGGTIGVTLSLVIKYVCATSYGLSVGFFPFVLVLIGIFVFTQLIDNYVFQPIIYSNSVQVHPLEIFIVFLVAGKIGGMVGMFIAVPAYTVLRVVAKQFFGDNKFVKMLTGGSI